MFEHVTEPEYLSFGTLNFLTQIESVESHFDVKPRLSADSNLLFLIGAPMDYQAPNNHVVLFIDPIETKRELPQQAYQITSVEPLTGVAFLHWANAAAQQIKDSLSYPGIVCTDFADFITILVNSPSRRLVLQMFEYNRDSQVLISHLQKTRYQSLYGCLFGSIDLGLSDYTALADAISQTNPQLGNCKLGTKIHPHEAMTIFLMGEPV